MARRTSWEEGREAGPAHADIVTLRSPCWGKGLALLLADTWGTTPPPRAPAPTPALGLPYTVKTNITFQTARLRESKGLRAGEGGSASGGSCTAVAFTHLLTCPPGSTLARPGCLLESLPPHSLYASMWRHQPHTTSRTCPWLSAPRSDFQGSFPGKRHQSRPYTPRSCPGVLFPHRLILTYPLVPHSDKC